MSRATVPQTFDPLAIHPFTSCGSTNTSTARAYEHSGAHAAYGYPFHNTFSEPYPAAPSNTPSPNSTPLHAPQPQPANAPFTPNNPGPLPIFVPYKAERRTPSLDDLLSRKQHKPSSWPMGGLSGSEGSAKAS
ncbi:hypothetical protein BOTBODRAFT_512454 [Botryobasidium botryosum FD-172 SS1]|uniref:Uncharacterized protein n=1 Tax=Botryobasidium botryosum (strain FD-172 SS1) TaxID=930990 RepID=A0A067N2U7_BOTB1|nr:hypothetical protein BOTBODRAFT_512454 [Botryobasidium botryosum FD-172 SS1]